ncbi:MAG: UvrD-helicase domain-containing protein, partial [Lentisphaeria bacterium]|nr:UvrD-helicase domain-containing protein [Lentisphaeria bacterium]
MNVLNHVADISLNKHAIIEASAGTGKTYTIGKLVIRIIRETNIPIEKILMVTFTEKATAELRDRIREYLEAEIAAENEPVILQKLKQAIGNYANAKIFTIHGFCQRTLQQYAFENRGYFDVEMVADRTLLQDVLNNLKRTWPGNEKWETLVKEYGYDLSTEETVIDLAMKIAPGFDELKPIPIDVQTEFVRLKEFDTNQALAEFDWLCQQKGHGPAFAKNKEIALLPYLEYVSLPSYEESLEFPNSWHGSGGIHGQVFKRKPNSLKQFSEELPNLTKMVALHESFAEVLVAQQRTFITQLVHILQKMALREKEQ